MTAEKYLCCPECESKVYACKNGKLDDSNDLAWFIEQHEVECDGPIFVCDESMIGDYDYKYCSGNAIKAKY